jgi:hypothetical protein
LNSSRSLIRTGRRRIIGHRAVSRRRDQSRRAANPITPASSSRANFLTTPDHSVQPAHRRRQNRRLQAGGRTGTGTPESTMAKTPAPEAASLVGAGRGTVIRRETVEAPPTEIRRDAAPWSAFSPQTSLTRTLAFLHLPPVGVGAASGRRRARIRHPQEDPRGGMERRLQLIQGTSRRGLGGFRQEHLFEGRRRSAAARFPGRRGIAAPALGPAAPSRRTLRKP